MAFSPSTRTFLSARSSSLSLHPPASGLPASQVIWLLDRRRRHARPTAHSKPSSSPAVKTSAKPPDRLTVRSVLFDPNPFFELCHRQSSNPSSNRWVIITHDCQVHSLHNQSFQYLLCPAV
ncbi:hypothetical protein LZ32DRAFT_607337 [Colletotrichum eremochloae]|nr:hypothetical protein LZ32DRAFT_607337 [Colletotrichum eremochloae]